MKKGYQGLYNVIFKRLLDILVSALVLILFGWLLGLLALAVRIKMGSPVIFCQERPGRIDPKTGKERMFRLYKFRSMTDARDERGNLLPASQRLTRFGRRLRATSLDELPEFWNILKGDMSLIGPRPLWANYLEYYNEFEHRRHLVRPGLTGLAQVNGRNATSWGKRFEYDNEYVRNVSLALDVKILLATVKQVLKHENVEFEKDHQPILDYFADPDRTKNAEGGEED